jgi:hypothetical protein
LYESELRREDNVGWAFGGYNGEDKLAGGVFCELGGVLEELGETRTMR